jgi:hypothetical protein
LISINKLQGAKMSFLKYLKTALATALLTGATSYSVGQNPLTLAEPDLTTQTGFKATCAVLSAVPTSMASTLPKKHIQAWVICKDIALLQQTASWGFNAFKRSGSDSDDRLDFSNKEVVSLFIQTQLRYMQSELASSRQLLQTLNIEAKDSLQLRPQTWVVDLDGDGAISPWEQRFFALPNRSNDLELILGMPGDSADVQLQALVKTDQSDVLWALSYHQFIEGIVEMARAQRFDFSGGMSGMILLSDKAAWARAYGLIKDGFDTSQAMRTALLAETDDDYEWIANPKQKNSAFPLMLDSGDFTTWGSTISDIQLLWGGKTLLQPSALARGVLGESARWCAEGSGLDVTKLFGAQAPRSILDLKNYTAACTAITADQPASDLVKNLESRAATGDMSSKMVRYLYWVN